ncbi:hypothetical protein CO661_14060 [Sinorhizobium fredii]|uniref:Uncharacterized protein n=1 Tax=Rhizobium fredii TaxID=380 RepID=A0A2A6LYI5_RHIFR|nr:hypothetical protein [Sinorhizobium fredii]PDT47302.1 hypothetical protein CO661_14060 [Sinorhizobium fredii]
MRRREFFSFAAAGAVTVPSVAHSEDRIQSLTEQIATAVRREFPDIKSVEITYNPEDERVPLVIVAFRI